MVSTEFQTPYTERQSATDSPPPLTYCKGTKKPQEMYVLSHMTGAFAIVEPTRMLTMKVAPMYKKVGTDICYILLDSSNNKFVPAIAMSGMLEHFPILETRRNVSDFTIKGTELTIELLEGTGINRTYMHMMALP